MMSPIVVEMSPSSITLCARITHILGLNFHTVSETAQEDEDFWSQYGSTIVFEVSKNTQVPSARGVGDRADDYMLNVSVDEQPLQSCLFKGNGGIATGTDFRNAVRDLLP